MKKILSVILVLTLVLTAGTYNYSAETVKAAVDDDLVLYLSFDKAAENGVVKADLGDYDATLRGSAKIDVGAMGTGLVLDGSSGTYADLEPGINAILGDSYTVAFWVKYADYDQHSHFFSFGNDSNNNFYMSSYNTGTYAPRLTVKSSDVDGGYNAKIVTNRIGSGLNEWHHVAITSDGTAVKIYFDGKLDTNGTYTGTAPSEKSSFSKAYLGKSISSENDPYFNGIIDEFRIYSKVISTGTLTELATRDESKVPEPTKAPEPTKSPEGKDVQPNAIFMCSDVHEYNDGVIDTFGYVVDEIGIAPAVAAVGGDYVYHIGGNDTQTEEQRKEVQDIFNNMSPNTETVFWQGNHDSRNAAGMNDNGVAFVNDYFVLYGNNLADLPSEIENVEAFLADYNSNPEYAGKPLILESHCPLDETNRTDHAGGTATRYVDILNYYGEEIDILYVFGHSHTEEMVDTYVPRGGTIDPENANIGDEVEINFSYMNMGFITNKDFLYSSGTTVDGVAYPRSLKSAECNQRKNEPGATAFEEVKANTVDSAYTTQDTVFFWDLTSCTVAEVSGNTMTINRYGYGAEATKENHEVHLLDTYEIELTSSNVPEYNVEPEPTQVPQEATAAPTTQAPQVTPVPQVTPIPTETVKVGEVKNVGKLKYTVTSVAGDTASGTVAVSGITKKTLKSIVIPKSITIDGKAYVVTEISKKAFSGCKKLKKITIKTTALKKVGKNAFKKTAKKLTFVCPKSKVKVYKKLFAKKGNTKIVVK